MALSLISQEGSGGEEDSWVTAMFAAGSTTSNTMHMPGVVIGQSQMLSDLEMAPISGLEDKEILPQRTVEQVQESFKGLHGPQQLVHRDPTSPNPCHALQPIGLQYYWHRVSCNRDKLVKVYCCSRSRLGDNVAGAHEYWQGFMTDDSVGPVLKACALAFSVVSTPDTATYLMTQWQKLQPHMDYDSPDYNIARFMVQYAHAWAFQSKDLEKAFTVVKDCYNDIEERNPENIFLAPYYTVTIGRWKYEINEIKHTLSEDIIMQVLAYADETLRLIGTLEDDWARLDTFGAKLSALKLLMLVEGYCKNFGHLTAFCRELRCRIDHLHKAIHVKLLQDHFQIVMYDAAWFYSVSATYYQNASIAATTQEEKDRLYTLGQRSLDEAAHLYEKNGRWWRARQEANRSDDPEIRRRYSNHVQNAPSVCQ